MRIRVSVSAALVTAMSVPLLLTSPTYATPKPKPKGDNGTVKIHDARTAADDRRNEPKVCAFYLDGFGFDALQKVIWHIEAWAVNELDKGETVKAGSLTLDGSGHGRTPDMTLPDGQYKLFWNFEGENGKAKHKVFKSDCEPQKESGTEPSKPAPEESKPGPKESKPVSEPSEPVSEPSKPAAEQPGGESPAPSAAPSGQGGGSGDLAETGAGAPVGVLATVAVALAGAGAFLVTRRRKAQQH
ncbi:LPXTG cell wall anchor domain-containing protein [Streptomyces purpureus]|uniref:LPXTG cell wall anchor domain-containing protein n=1 Tax=Streptomyces purpureus TaxID=1951 RepID=UPI0037ABCE5D